MGAPVGRVGAPLDHSGGVELVDEPAERDRRDVERLGKLALFRALAALEARKHGPLGAGGVEFPGAMVRVGAQKPRGVVEGECDLSAT